MSKRILVTGGAGLIGSFLCDQLLARNYDVICLDDFSTGSVANVGQLIENQRFSIVEHDIIKPYHARVDEIYNCACPAAPIHYQKNPVKTIRTSVQGALNMLELAHETGAKILQTSTSEVYGDPLVHPQTEDYWGNVNPIGIRACYDEGKRCAEALFFDYKRQYNVSIRVARIFNTYGPRMHLEDGRVVSNFIIQALKKQPITIYGDGSQTRSFCYVSDLVGGLIRLMEAPDAQISGPINLGNPNEFTVGQLAQKVIKLTGSQSGIEYRSLPLDDPKKRQPDIHKATNILQWKPEIELEQGLIKTISYFEAVLKNNC